MASEFDERFDAKRRGERIEESPPKASRTTLDGVPFFSNPLPEGGTYSNIPSWCDHPLNPKPPSRLRPVGKNGKPALDVPGEEVRDVPALPERSG